MKMKGQLLVIVALLLAIDGHRLFKRMATDSVGYPDGLHLVKAEKMTLTKCAMACAASPNCHSFNYGTFEDKSIGCDLLPEKAQQFQYRKSFSYYEEDIAPFVLPEDYCLNYGEPVDTGDVSGQSAKCNCLPSYRGDRCETYCYAKMENFVVCDASSSTIGDHAQSTLSKCIRLCIKNDKCQSIVLNDSQRCILKDKPMPAKDDVAGNYVEIYSIVCN